VLAEELALVPLALTGEGVDVALLDVTRLADTASTASRYLTPSELEEYARLRLESRRREWLGARVCLKTMLLERRCVSDPTQCELVKDAAGRPRLSFAAGWPAEAVHDCSLSHKGRFACAGASRLAATRVGVDIEEISPRLLRVERAFAGDRDRPFRPRPAPERLALLWALKEACAKAVGGGLGLVMGAITCEETEEGRHHVRTEDGRQFQGRHVVHDGYVVVLCSTKDETRAPAQ
jgi:phosphopantetheinyl transferase